ncbi:telomeric repeat-binding factor 2-interacting protein 1 [Mastacembelus armatus]|uniref:telomeric repeat-binding factor 2-interacting protein 1 n=1 Tax=Mastacembelus armatus TaxID=205130 RepID=UPI001436B8AC|nr:telomeric repeat-binding factor 2-interacting protein 1 [Mastacembelus armatus]
MIHRPNYTNMPSKQQDVAKYDISPVLFMTVDGEPMSFFLRPGPIKRKLQPLITAGGGLLCNIQQPGAHLLIDPKERGSIAETTAHWYVSIQYIHDCIEKGEQLNLEDYRLIPEVVPRHSARLNSSKEGSPGLGGRVAFTSEEDAAILSYVSKHLKEIGGNRLWQEMEKQHVTSHSWQSMKYRYRARLAKRQSEIEKVKTSEEDSMEEGNQDADIQITSCEEDAVPSLHSPSADPLQTHATETDLRQKYTQPTQNTSENTEAQPFSSVQEVQPVNPQTEIQTGESAQAKTAETETSKSPQTEGSCLDPHTDVSPIPAESAEPETVEVQTIISPQNESMPEDSLQSLPNTTTPTKQKASPKLDNTAQRRITRRQLEQVAQSSPEPYGKKHRSSLATAEKPSSPQPLRRAKLTVKSTLQNDRTIDQPPSKRARAQREAAESPLKESEKTAVSETPQADETSNSLPQKGEKKKEQKKLGILEMATKEFEDESESGEDEAAVPPNTTETGTMQPTSSENSLVPPDTAADPSSAQTNPEPGPSLQTDVQEAQASTSKHVLENACPDEADEAAQVASRAHLFIFNSESQEDDSQSVVGVSAAGHVASKPHIFIFNSESQEKDSQSVIVKSAAGHVASRAHMFIFNSESQEKDSESPVRDSTAGRSQPAVNEDAAFSLTKTQLEEDKQRISELMNQTNKDLISVTKALLKTSGDFCAAQKLLLNPSSISGPFWKRSDDDLLLSADPAIRQQLQDKYGEVGFAKRILFLEAEG